MRKQMLSWLLPSWLLLALLAACGQDSTPAGPEPTAERQEPLYVYSAYEDVEYLPALFAEFSAETGILVVVRHRDDEQNLDDMRSKSGSQPADLLLTASVAPIWQAAEEGLLRPLPPDSSALNVREAFRDPDGLWVAVTADPMVLLRNGDVDAAISYASLGQDVVPLCVSSSTLAANRALLAWMIAATDAKTTEYSVRRWMSALQLPPRDNYDDVIEALDSGACKEALLPLSVVPNPRRAEVIAPEEVFFDIEGIGIGRHARSPKAAAELINWLLTKRIQAKHATATGRLPISDSAEGVFSTDRLSTRGIAAVGFLYPDAVLLAERARYR